MPWFEFSQEPLPGGIDGLKVTGTEYLTSISVQTTGNQLVWTQAGQTIYSVPIHPKFFSGTRLLALARLYQKYRYKRITFEYIPTVPSTQDGSIMMYMDYDIENNISVIGDLDTRLREAMSHLGSRMFNVYTYGRTSLEDDNQLDSYYFETGIDPRTENQGVLNVIATSTYAPVNSAEGAIISLGNIIVHYEIELFERGLNNDPSVTQSGTYEASSAVINQVFAGYGADSPLRILQTTWSNQTGVILKESQIAIYIPTQSWTMNSLPINVNTKSGENIHLFTKGSVWYLFSMTDFNAYQYIGISDSLSSAMIGVADVYLTAAISGQDLCEGSGNYRTYSLAKL